MLTPIWVRGRRRKRPAEESFNDENPRPIPSGPKGGRPLMSRQAKLDSSQAKTDKRARLLVAKPTKQRKKLSNLESLPVELIEKIFLYSLNVNFARCSLPLIAAISSERIYRALILLAFWDDTSTTAAGTRASETAISRILRPLDYSPLRDADRRQLQDTILRCKWCTVQRLLAQLPDLMNLCIQRHWFGAGIVMAPEQEDALNRFLAQEQDIRTFEGTDPTSTTTTDDDDDDDDDDNPTHYTLTINPLVSITITHHETDQTTTHPILGVLLIPPNLLQGGPLDSEEEGFTSPAHTNYLETLRIASGFNRTALTKPTVTLSRPALQRGIHTALVENNRKALTTLLKIDEYHFRAENTDIDPASAAMIPYTLPAEHFRTAVRVARRDPVFFQILLRASAESVPADDPEITEWAMQQRDAFGAWLLDLMLHLPEQIEAARTNPAEQAVFYLGRANAQRGLARRYLREVLGVEELGSWLEESTFDVSGLWKIPRID
ncbi:hypothetical protein BO70DRAFT_381840 [Aspergillus heteromorphus CBS 117.55]|uniref:Uncharacterized protein n=1 Tax=Aspergillus heteromorphus CBS 117.55 TaxID=1448321 RepID=A0A317VD55_9EURO|nr:uncharacterized protein BO70DRAFT_381840 [Aspergillus heteromorphus CBS 117.55]PWY72303.1 hypothetical protein BO70DRAFT_381840 [Aspergillus heteromorphus CBS 117.55]